MQSQFLHSFEASYAYTGNHSRSFM